MKAFVTGGAGFIGSNLAGRLLKSGAIVTAYDNLLLGRRKFVAPFLKNKKFRFIKADILTDKKLVSRLKGYDVVFHMSANSDIPMGIAQTDYDLKLNTIATQKLLDAMRKCGVKKIVFASTSAIYGDAKIKPTPESYGPLFPESLYGASKLAAEGLITAFAVCHGIQAWIFRFSNVAGINGTHGVMIDFIEKLKRKPGFLKVLGDGNQAKPYIHVDECVDGMIFGFGHAKEKINCFNLTCEGATNVKKIAEWILKEMKPDIPIKFTGGKRGWPGDIPQVRLDGKKMARLGWRPRLTSDEAVKKAIRELVKQRVGET